MYVRLRSRNALLSALSLFLITLSLFDTTGARQARRRNEARGPRLVLVIVIDQFREDYLTRFGDLFGDGGFRRLLGNGALFANSHYRHACTYTAPGHATVLTGSVPALTGIVGNAWFDRPTGLNVTSVTDANFVGIPEGRGAAPTRLRVTTVADQLRLATNWRSKAVGVSLKDRSAILPIGRGGDAAYWFDTATGRMQTSSYYLNKLPDWVAAFNDRKIPDSRFGKTWDLALPAEAYERADRDDAPYERGFKGGTTAFPHTVTGGGTKPGPVYYDEFTRTPWANEYLVDFAEAAIENEKLGADDVPDVLTVSFSANDLVGHAFGPYSREVEDITVRTDKTLARLLAMIDKRVGLTNTLIALTADHGVGPVPEYAQAKRLGGRRIPGEGIFKAVDQTLTEKFGEGPWIARMSGESIYLNLDTIRARKLNQAEVERTAGEAALAVRGVAAYFTRTQLLNGPVPPTAMAERVVAAFNPQNSGDLYLVPEPFAFFEEGGTIAATHGTPYGYDTHVPVILMGRGIKPGVYAEASSPSDIAPTLCALLGIEAPNGCVGRILTEALDRAGTGRKTER